MKDYFEVPRKYLATSENSSSVDIHSYFQVPRKYALLVGATEPTHPDPVLPPDPVEPTGQEFMRVIQYAGSAFSELGFSAQNPFTLPDQIYLEIDGDEHLYKYASKSGRDVYFRDSQGELLPYELVSYGYGIKGKWWIKANATVKADRLVYMYYGDHSRNTDGSEDIWQGTNAWDNYAVIHGTYTPADGESVRPWNSRNFDGENYASYSTDDSIAINKTIGYLDMSRWDTSMFNPSFLLCMEYKPSYINNGAQYYPLSEMGYVKFLSRNEEVKVTYDQFVVGQNPETGEYDIETHARQDILNKRIDTRAYPVNPSHCTTEMKNRVAYIHASNLDLISGKGMTIRSLSNGIYVFTSNYITNLKFDIGTISNSIFYFTTGFFEIKLEIVNNDSSVTIDCRGDDCIVENGVGLFFPEKYTSYEMYINPNGDTGSIIVTKVNAPYIPNLFMTEVERGSTETIRIKRIYFDWINNKIESQTVARSYEHTERFRDGADVIACAHSEVLRGYARDLGTSRTGNGSYPNESKDYATHVISGNEEHLRLFEYRSCVPDKSINTLKSLYAMLNHQNAIRSISPITIAQNSTLLLL